MSALITKQSERTREHYLLEGFARSVRNNALGEVAVQLTRVAGIVYLARHLEPADFGLYRMLLVISSLAILTIEGGIPEALIQRKVVRPDHEATGWWINCAIGLVTVEVLYQCAPIIAQLLVMPRIAAELRLLCIPLLLVAASTTGSARLRRSFRFGSIALADTLAELAFLASAIILLVLYESPRWSLAGGLAVRFTVQAIVILIASAYIPNGLPSRKAARELAPFALSVWSGRSMVTLSFNVDFLLIGRILGSTMLGYYTIAWDLLRFVPNRLFIVVGRVTLPLFSQMQDDDAGLRQRYCDFVRETARILLPVMTGLAVAAPEVVVALYGVRWHPAAAPLRALAVGIALVGVTIGIGGIYYAKGRPVLDLYLHSARLALIVVVVSALAPNGLLPASIGMSAVEGTMAIVGQLLVCSLIALGARQLLAAFVPGIRNSVLAAIATEIGRLLASSAGLHPTLALVVIVALPAITIAWVEMSTLIEIVKLAAHGRIDSKASPPSTN